MITFAGSPEACGGIVMLLLLHIGYRAPFVNGSHWKDDVVLGHAQGARSRKSNYIFHSAVEAVARR